MSSLTATVSSSPLSMSKIMLSISYFISSRSLKDLHSLLANLANYLGYFFNHFFCRIGDGFSKSVDSLNFAFRQSFRILA